MTRSEQHRGSGFARLAGIAGLLILLVSAVAAQAQTFQVLHNFTGGADGGWPVAGITFDQQGRIYGTTNIGGSYASGVVYRLVHEGAGWVLSPIYNFPDGDDSPYSTIFGPDGLLYGTTYMGGAEHWGTVFSLRPPATACKAALCPWIGTVLYNFSDGADGGFPEFGDLTFDQAGNIYGTTGAGGSLGNGVVFKLTHSGSSWTESVLWNFGTINNDGYSPISGVIFDHAGNLYGTTSLGGSNGFGTVYELSPTQSGWNETILYSFTNNDNGFGAGGLIMDAHGDLFGITGIAVQGSGGPGAAYELTPQNGGWSFTLLQSFSGTFMGPEAAPTFDSQGNLYGPLPSGGSDEEGEIFKLTPSGSQWIYNPFYQFNGSDGQAPFGAVIFDASGNMYGTAAFGRDPGCRDYGCGTVWEITP